MRSKLFIIGATCLAFIGITAIVISCKKDTDKTVTGKQKPGSVSTAARFTGSLSSYSTTAITKTAANTLISDYISDANLVPTTSFIYDAHTLLSYMGDCDDIENLHVFLGEETVNSVTHLTLVLAGANSSGEHIYIQDGTPTVDYVMDHVSPCPDCAKTIIENPIDATAYVPAEYSNNLLLSDAQSWVGAYQARTTKNTTASSFLINAANLADYIANAPNIDIIQFFLAENTGTGALTLVIVGIDSYGNQIYISNGGNTYALDHASPCPDCSIYYDNGASLE